MLLGIPTDLKIVRGSVYKATYAWIDKSTGEYEDFSGLSATIKIKNIHEDFKDEDNLFTVGTTIIEPLDNDGQPFKGRIEITLSAEETKKLKIPESEEDPYGESDYYAVMSIILSTGEIALQGKVRVIESLEN